MPELPEVETIVRNLSPKLIGLKIESFRVLFPPVLRNGDVSDIRKLRGKKILDIHRRGKMILINCEDNLSLLFHLKMTGKLLFCPQKTPFDKHTHFVLSFKGQEKELRFRDVRKFGFIFFIQTPEVFSSEKLRDLGPEPLEIDYPFFAGLFKGRKARIKNLLLNQKFIAGIGNIYADEILFRAKIHPLTEASLLSEEDKKRLWKAMRKVLRDAIEKRGSSIRDYTDAEGKQGNFQNYHQVYGRRALPCRICGEKIERLRLGGRSSFFCPSCQNLRRAPEDRRGKTKEIERSESKV